MAKAYYWAVFVDETGCEFGAGCHARNHDEAYDTLSESYPESRIVQLESPQDTAAREARMYAELAAELDGDFYHEEDY